MNEQTFTRDCKDIIRAGKLRVVVLQTPASVEDATIDDAIERLTAELEGARASMHVIPIEEDKRYKNRIVVELSEYTKINGFAGE